MNLEKIFLLGVGGAAALILPIMIIGSLDAPAILAQDVPDWQVKAGGKMAFEVASVKVSKGEFVPPAYSLDAGEAYSPTMGGRFKADFPLSVYIQFAYKISPTENQTRDLYGHLPNWVTTDRYTIDARATGNPTKDQMRIMVQSLLADRFQLAAHFETREIPVLALSLVKPGQLGPKLHSHGDGPPCDASATRAVTFPPFCDSFAMIRESNGLRLAGYRNATMDMLAASISGLVGQGRPVINKTELSGRYDFTIEWAPESAAVSASDSGVAPPDPLGATPLQALRDQLGLKLESTKGPDRTLVIDKVERPSEN